MSGILSLAGKTIGKYQIIEHIGHGGMAEVYKAEHIRLGRMVAVKVLHPFLADEEGFVVRFQREARIVATLRHPNIVQVYDFDYNDEIKIYYMVMEYIDGPTLKSRLAKGALPVLEAVHVGIAIAEALEYAHKRGMIHRDVKPANIMFTSDNQPVLTDFGIAKMLSLTDLTASGAMIGTPAYMSPEIGMGKHATESSDIYSLGVVLYQMLTGRLPFESDSPMGMVMQHINDAPPLPAQFVPTLPSPVEVVVLRALNKQPEDRFATAGEMAAALRRAIGLDTPPSDVVEVTEPPISADEEESLLVKTWPSENEAITPTPMTPTARRYSTSPPQVQTTQPPRKRKMPLLRAILLLLVLLSLTGLGWEAYSLGKLPPTVQQWLTTQPYIALPGLESPAPTATATAKVETPTATPRPPATPTFTVAPIITPTATLNCALRVRTDEVHLEPDGDIPPGSNIVAYVTLRNQGACPWPTALQLAFASGEQMQAPSEPFPIRKLAPGEQLQVIIPMQAPAELGTYTSRWEIREPNGHVVGQPVVIKVNVADVPTPTPSPQAATAEGTDPTPTVQPMELAQPVLKSWQDNEQDGTWQGTISLQASGGQGDYRFYRDKVSAATLLPQPSLTFRWQRCKDYPLKVWVLSGNEVSSWEGVIPYPAADQCR